MSDNEAGSLAHRTVRNVAWLGSGQAIRQVVSLLTMIVLARFLGPSEFGIFAMALFVNELAQLVVDFGMGAALVQRKEINQLVLSSCFWINVVVAGVAALILFAAGPWIAAYFEQPAVRWLMLSTGLNLLLSAMAVLPQALLSRQLAFRDIAIGTLVGSLCGAATAVGLAVAGAGVWALAFQPVVGTAVTLLVLGVRARWLPSLSFDLRAVSGMLKFSGQLLLSNIASHVTRNLTSLILGPAMGVAALGMINMAQTIAWLPVAQFSQTVVKATFPVFAKLQDEMDRFREGFYRATGLVALFAFPLMTGIALLADDLVPVVFGPKWEPASVLVSIACVPALVQSVTTLSGTTLLARGRADFLLRVSLVSLPVTAILLWWMRKESAPLAMMALAFSMIFASVVTLASALQATGATWRRYLGVLLLPVTCSAAMAVVLWLLKHWLDAAPAAARLIGLSLAGAVIYLGLVWITKRAVLLDALDLVKGQRNG